MSNKIEVPHAADLCEECGKTFIGLNGSTKWCPYCGSKHEGETVPFSFAAEVVMPTDDDAEVAFEHSKFHGHDVFFAGFYAAIDKVKELNNDSV